MPVPLPPTVPPPLGSIPQARWRPHRTLPALLRTLNPRLRDAVTEAYFRLGGSLGRLNPRRRRVLIQALGSIIDRMACCAFRLPACRGLQPARHPAAPHQRRRTRRAEAL